MAGVLEPDCDPGVCVGVAGVSGSRYPEPDSFFAMLSNTRAQLAAVLALVSMNSMPCLHSRKHCLLACA